MHVYFSYSVHSWSLVILFLSLMIFHTPSSTAIRSSKSIWSINWFWRDNVKILPIPEGVEDPEEFIKSQKKSKATWSSYKYWCSIFLPDYFPDEGENSPEGGANGEGDGQEQDEKNPWPINVEYGMPIPFYPDYAVRVVPKTPRFSIKSVRF